MNLSWDEIITIASRILPPYKVEAISIIAIDKYDLIDILNAYEINVEDYL